MNKEVHQMSELELAQYLDYAVLNPNLTLSQLRELITIGIDYCCKSICVNPAVVPLAKELVKGTKTAVCAVLDFPFGQSSTKSKVEQARVLLEEGGLLEIDMVANYGLIKSKEAELVEADIKAVVDICHSYNVGLKVILETDALTKEEIALGVQCAIDAGADFVKTSTGFYDGDPIVGASPEVIRFMLEQTKGRIKIKGSGCVRSRERMLELITLGVDRLGIGNSSVHKLINKERL
jgi:deoxyribose-phosphate aldolase